MRRILLSIIIIVSGLLLLAGYNSYINLPRTEIDIKGLKNGYFEGSEIAFRVNLINLSRVEKCLSFNTRINLGKEKVDFPTTYFIVRKGERITNRYGHMLPEDIAGGTYNVELEFTDRALGGEKLLVRKILPFKVIRRPMKPVVVPLDGNIKLPGLQPEYNFKDKLPIKIMVENIANRAGRFQVNVNIKPSLSVQGDIKPYTFTEVLNLDGGGKKTLKFELQLSNDKPDGKYIVSAGLSDKDSDRLLSSDRAGFAVVDRPPEIVFEDMGLSVKKGEQALYKVRVSDDKGVKSVKYCRRDLKTGSTTDYMMILSSGDASAGIWTYASGIIKKANRFKFYITAVDSKNQETKTVEYSVSVLGK